MRGKLGWQQFKVIQLGSCTKLLLLCMTILHTCKVKGKTEICSEANVPTGNGEMSILFEGGCGLEVAKRNWRSASVNTGMAFKLTSSASQPTQSNTCCMLINIIWLFSLWWEGPKLQFFTKSVLLWYQNDDLINKSHCKGRVWTKEKVSESQQCQNLKFGWDGGREVAKNLLSRGDSG